jgi:hypothetical protein
LTMSVIDEIRRDVQAAKILSDWIGEGSPVSQRHANGRALVCLRGNEGKECPYHKAERWWDVVKHAIAERIKQQIGIKNRMQLSTPHDADLKMCSACGCAMPVKVWVPMKHVVEHTPKEVFDKMPSYCWQVKERSLL